MTLPVEIFEILERQVGRDDAKEVIKVIEGSFDVIEKKAEHVALQKKLEIKDELTKELATKEDIATVKGEIKIVREEIKTVRVEIKVVREEIKTLRVELKGEIKLHFYILLAAIALFNPSAIELIARLLGIKL